MMKSTSYLNIYTLAKNGLSFSYRLTQITRPTHDEKSVGLQSTKRNTTLKHRIDYREKPTNEKQDDDDDE